MSSGGLTNISDEEFRTLLVQHYELYEALVQVVPYDCNWDYMLTIGEHISSRAYLFPIYEVTGSVEAILSNREFRMRLSHSSTVKGLTMMRLRRLAETRVELMRRARELLEDL